MKKGHFWLPAIRTNSVLSIFRYYLRLVLKIKVPLYQEYTLNVFFSSLSSENYRKKGLLVFIHSYIYMKLSSASFSPVLSPAGRIWIYPYYEIVLASVQHVSANFWTMPGNGFRKQLAQTKKCTKHFSKNLRLQAFKLLFTNLFTAWHCLTWC